MLISHNWLKKHVNTNSSFSPEEIGAKLKASTVEVENIIIQGENLRDVVVGKVLSADKHPNADKLKLCKVDIGNEQLQIVCGGSNVAEGMSVAVAKIGARVKWHGEGELITMEPAKIRGVESFGMICASTEIGLADVCPLKDEKEIMDLTAFNAVPGTPLAQVFSLDDAIFEIDNKTLSHRPDLWGHYGIAREVAILFGRTLQEYKTAKIKELEKKAEKKYKLEVSVEDESLCSRYMAVAVSGIKIAESPAWLKTALLSVGMRPINNVVDITNYIMLELGQPMHAFDANFVAGDKKKNITVRTAGDGEKMLALDGKEYALENSDLVIASGEKAIALAGVIGGKGSEVSSNTETIIFESANFYSTSIRKTSNRLGLRTESAVRFEKSLDPNMCETALCKAVEMVMALCPEAKVASNFVDKKNFVLKTGPVVIEADTFRKKMGVEVEAKQIINILEKLGFSVTVKKKSYSVKIPTWRATKDISIAEDIIEEVVRIFGFENIPSSLPFFPINSPAENKLRLLERKIKNVVSEELGYSEVYNYSFVSEHQILNFGDDPKKYLELDNPLSKEKPFLRRNLLQNLLENVRNNIEKYSEVKIFEVGRVFTNEQTGLRAKINRDELLPKQDSWFTAMYCAKGNDAPFWQARKIVETIFQALNIKWDIVKLEKVLPWEHPSRVALFGCADTYMGVMHELHPSVTEASGVANRVGVVRINLDILSEVLNKVPRIQYEPLSNYPVALRDVALIVGREITHEQILSSLAGIDVLLTKIELFDVYEGANLQEGRKSMGYHFTYSATGRTLTAEEVDLAHEKVVKMLTDKFAAEVRK